MKTKLKDGKFGLFKSFFPEIGPLKLLSLFFISTFLCSHATAEVTPLIWMPGQITFSSLPGSIPFSFNYGGQAFDTRTWKYSQISANSWSYLDRERKLLVTIKMESYLDFGATKWYLTFENLGSSTTKLIDNVQVANLNLIGAITSINQRFSIFYNAGALGDDPRNDGSAAATPVSDFTPILNSPPPNVSLQFTSSQGRSSSGVMPYFNIQYPDTRSGLIVAIGWSGQWRNSFAVDGTGTNFSIKAGQQYFSAQLRPGEKVRTPAILIMPWTGENYFVGQNQFRQLMLKYFTPKDSNGQAPKPIGAASTALLASAWERLRATDIKNAITNIKNSGIPLNTIWNDAGWYPVLTRDQNPQLYDYLTPRGADNLWLTGLGDWMSDPVRYPSDYRDVSEAAHQAGFKSLLWFEPERVSLPARAYSRLASQYQLLQDPVNEPYHPQLFELINFSDGNVVNQQSDLFKQKINLFGLDIFRQDFNINQVLSYWQKNDANQSAAMGGISRTGITEAAYIAGLYNFWDTLRAAHPDLVIDNCASGGRRLDFEALSRTVALWRSDRVWDPVEQQNQMLGLAMWVPLQGRGTDSVTSLPAYGLSGDELLKYKIRSGYGWTGVYAFNWNALTPATSQLLKKEVTQLFGPLPGQLNNTSLAEIFKGDFYSMDYSQQLSVVPVKLPGLMLSSLGNLSTWTGWQFVRPDLDISVVQLFKRSKEASSSNRFVLKGLKSNQVYSVKDLDTGISQTIAGQTLLNEGLTTTCSSAACAKVFLLQKNQ